MTKISGRNWIMAVVAAGMAAGMALSARAAEPPVQDVMALNKMVVDMSVENQTLRSNAAIRKDEYDLMVMKLEAVEKKLARSTERYLKLEQKVSGLSREVVFQQRINKDLLKDLQTVRAQDTQRTQKYDRMISEVTREKTSNASAAKDKVGLLQMMQSLEEKKAALDRENERLLDKINRLQMKNGTLVKTAEKIVAEKARFCFKVIPRKANVPRAIQQLQDKNNLLNDQNRAIVEKNAHLAKLNAELQMSSKEFFIRNKTLENKTSGCDSLSDALSRLTIESAAFRKDNAYLKKQLDTLKENLNIERATIYREAGAAYSETELFDQAINVYLESLKLDPDDVPTYYYLGLLYSKTENSGKAIYYFQKYLELDPRAENKDEVQYIISLLEGRDDFATK